MTPHSFKKKEEKLSESTETHICSDLEEMGCRELRMCSSGGPKSYSLFCSGRLPDFDDSIDSMKKNTLPTLVQ